MSWDVVLGTVQLGVPYGRRRDAGVMSESDVWVVLDAAWSHGITTFDTAEAYGCSAERLSRWLHERKRLTHASVVTKIVAKGPDIGEKAREALTRFDGAAETTLLSHGFVEGDDWARLAGAALALGHEAGQSVYSSEEVADCVRVPDVRRVQLPANVFSLAPLSARGNAPVPVDVRSVFLQGLLLDDRLTAERRVPGGGQLADAVARAARAVGVAPAAVLVAAMGSQLRAGDRLVIGIDSPSELAAVARARSVSPETVKAFVSQLSAEVETPTDRVLDPRRW